MVTALTQSLKRKASRLRDWNSRRCWVTSRQVEMLEKKSISITRLKLTITITDPYAILSWKEKHLDYEIETSSNASSTDSANTLEKKSISITRLKPSISDGSRWYLVTLKRKASRLRDWNGSDFCSRASSSETRLKRKASRLRDWNLEECFHASR